MPIVRYTGDEARKLKGDSDYASVGALTDEQIEEATHNDSDIALPTPEQLKDFKQRKGHCKKTISSCEVKSLVDATDWNRVTSLTESQIEETVRQEYTAPTVSLYAAGRSSLTFTRNASRRGASW